MKIKELENALENSDSFYLYYKDPEFVLNNPSVSAHMYIILPCNNDECIIITLITSSKKYEKIYNKKQLECVINIEIGKFDFITKECIIDCNKAEIKSKTELIENGARVYECDNKIPQEIIIEIKQKIKQSPIVKRKVKKALL